MNIKKAATKLAKLYEEEKDHLPLIPLDNGSLGYKNYIIKKDRQGNWAVYQKSGHTLRFLDKFNLKSSACMAAKYYDRNNIMGTHEVRNLDNGYWNNQVDSEIFKHYFDKTKDLEKRDIFLWRWELTSQRAKFYKEKITSAFKVTFR
jgi:hypothetical protein